MATFKAELNSRPKPDGTNSILIRITANRKLKRINSGEGVQKKFWNSQPKQNNNGILQYVKRSHPSHRIINERIHQKIEEAKHKINKLSVTTPQTIEQALKGNDSESFFSYAEEHLDRLRHKNFGTWDQYKASINKLRAFCKNNDLLFEEITHSFLERYRAHLYSIGNSTNTIYKNIKCIRALMYSAIREGKFKQEKNPFFTFKLEWKKTKKEALTSSEIDKIIELELKPGSLIWHVRNFWLLSFYLRGIRVRDFIQLKHKNFQDGRIVYQMDKTSHIVSIKVNELMQGILSYYLYDGAKPEQFVFPLLSNDKDYSDSFFRDKEIKTKTALYNKYLKKLATLSGIDKRFSSHVARHTFANIANKKLKDIYKVQKMLGHSSVKVTENYLQGLEDTSLDADTDIVFNP